MSAQATTREPSNTRSWACARADLSLGRRERVAHVVARHGILSGACKLEVYSDENVETSGPVRVVFGGNSAVINFEVGISKGELRVTSRISGFKYDLTFEGAPVLELQDRPVSEVDAAQPPAAARVESYEISGGTAFFFIKVTSGGASHLLKKRYSEFATLDELVKQSYSGSHLKSSLPALPSKYRNPLTNQLEAAFLDARRDDLDVYVQRVMGMPRGLAVPDVRNFFGLSLQ
ncbi:hypothetical protein M885DRAFT_526262 [Pelagophyceae sp. CCMP2097]|nr:hypothetical protein M885DRAFT_526262 [Pelagophyceae sp. CCMP2097]